MNRAIKEYYESVKVRFSELEILPVDEWPEEWTKIEYRATSEQYTSLGRNRSGGELEDLLVSRRSRREFVDKPTPLEKMDELLLLSMGRQYHVEDFHSRMYPSAGARYPLETYVIINNVEDVDKGMYHYDAENHGLSLLQPGNHMEKMKELVNSSMGSANIMMVLTGVMERSECKYGNTALRFAYIEAGHVGQNLYLVSEKLDLGCCAIGGFENDQLSEFLNLDAAELPVYMFAIGNHTEPY